jgi:hypothetical protein
MIGDGVVGIETITMSAALVTSKTETGVAPISAARRGQALRASRVRDRELAAELGELTRERPSKASSTDDADPHVVAPIARLAYSSWRRHQKPPLSLRPSGARSSH